MRDYAMMPMMSNSHYGPYQQQQQQGQGYGNNYNPNTGKQQVQNAGKQNAKPH